MRINIFRRIPVFFVIGFGLVLAFTFVDWNWLFSTGSRLSFVILWGLGGGFVQAMDNDLKFWGRK